jgi:hypothetical protein
MSLTNLTITSAAKNYITNSTFDVDTTGYATYADGAATPVDGTGGSPTLTLTASTSSPLRGAKSGLITAGALGNGVSFDFSIDAADKGKTLAISFDYAIASGTMVTGDYTVYVYDVTNSQMIQPYGYQIPSVSQGTFLATFPTNSNSTSYRLIINQSVSSTANIKIDNVSVSAQQAIQGMAGSGWQQYTPTFTNFGTPTNVFFQWRQVGDTMEIMGTFTPGSVAASVARVSIPSPYLFDTTKLSSSGSIVGHTTDAVTVTSGNVNATYVFVANGQTSNLSFGGVGNGSSLNNLTEQTSTSIFSSSSAISLWAKVPIAGWSSNVTMANSSTFRISSYLANGSRVTGTAPTALGQYRSYLRNANANTFTETSGAPTTAPTASDGIKIYAGNAYSSADTANSPTRYEIFVGKNKNVRVDWYGTSGRTGYFDASPKTGGSGNLDYGYVTSYDPTTGILVVSPFRFYSGTTGHQAGVNDIVSGQSSAYFDVTVSENALAVGVQAPRSEVYVDTPNGYGSTNTKIRRFTTVQANTGTAITYTDSATLGGSFTINEDGVYAISYVDRCSGTTGRHGISVSTTAPTTAIDSLTYAAGYRGMTQSGQFGAVNAFNEFNKTLILRSGDVVRAHTDGVPSSTDTASFFSITKVSN